MKKQVMTHIVKWADIISVHSTHGLESIKALNFMSIILIGELSTKDCNINDKNIANAQEILTSLDNIVGVVCQQKLTNLKLNIVPGISLKSSNDGIGQCHTDITSQSKEFAYIYVIGRSIVKSEHPKKTLDEFLAKISI